MQEQTRANKGRGERIERENHIENVDERTDGGSGTRWQQKRVREVANGSHRHAEADDDEKDFLDALLASDARAIVQLCTCDDGENRVNGAQDDVALAEFAVPYRGHDSLSAVSGEGPEGQRAKGVESSEMTGPKK